MSDAFKQEIEAVIAEDDTEEVHGIVIEIAMGSDDASWSQDKLIALSTHADTDVRGAALIAFAHLAQRFGGLDAARVRPAVERGLDDPKAHVREQAEATREALQDQLGWWSSAG
jgi:hypothetical protein